VIGMENPQQGIRLRSSARTSTGQVRENNEDNIHLWTRDDFVLAVVADGMGGAAAGEEASRIAVETIKSGLALRDQAVADNLVHVEDNTLTERLRETIQTANQSIVDKAASSPEFRGMGTTVTLAFVRGTYAIVAHVGDSRAYLVDGDDQTISQITSDHSFVEALLAAGHITQEQADEHPMRNVLYRALGQAEDIDVDMYYKRLHVGDRLVLCSDGLTRHVKPDEIAKLALSDPNPDIASQKLIDLANERGGEDNVSVIVISVELSTPTSPSYRQAVIERDEDDTLVLKGRDIPRPDTGSLDRAPSDRIPASGSTLPISLTTPSPDASLPEEKMMAERLKDSPEMDTDSLFQDEDITQDSDAADDSDDPLLSLPTIRFDEPVIESALPDAPPEAQVEGRDTLLPDQ
jgi:PPM family protein phosphatase